MSDDKKQKGIWRLLLDYKKQKGTWRLLSVAVALGSVITVGYLTYQNKDREWAKWTGLGETQVITEKIEKNEQGRVVKITESKQTQPGKTFWNGLELSSRLLVPLLIFIFGLLIQKRDKDKDKAEQIRRGKEQKDQALLEKGIAQDNLAEEAIQAYLDNMAKLLLNEEYREKLFPAKEEESILFLRICLLKLAVGSRLPSLMQYASSIMEYSQENIEKLFPTKDNPVRDIARTQTITILRRLKGDTERQARVIHFLNDAELYQFILKNANLSKINLQEAQLLFANLQGAYLLGANLQEAYLESANLKGAGLLRANLQEANLGSANLQGAYLMSANLQETKLWKANLQGADLMSANLQGANLDSANLQGANLRYANLQEAYLESANLQEANLGSANLQGACLMSVDLQGANLSRVNLQGANLDSAKLKGVNLSRAKNLTSEQIKSACNWEQAIYKGKWDWDEEAQTWVPKNKQAQQDNDNYIDKLKQNRTSDPQYPPDSRL